MTDKTGVVLQSEKKGEAEEVMRFVEELTNEEKLEFLGFMRGARFVKGMNRQKIEDARTNTAAV